MTSQLLKNRINGHKYSNTNNTALNKHKNDLAHNFNFSNTKILAYETNLNKRTFKEMIYIKKDNKAINDRTDIKNLSKIYNNLF